MALPEISSLPKYESLVSAWDFDNDATDAVGSNDLTNNNSITYVDGQFDAKCADIEISSSQYFSRTDNASLDLTSHKVFSAWVNFESLPVSGVQSFWICSKWGASGNRAWNCGVTQTGANYNLVMYNSTTGSNANLGTALWGTSVSTDTWYHLIWVYDATAGSFKGYVDGEQIGTTATGMGGSTNNSSAALNIGASNNSGSYDGKKQAALLYGGTTFSDQDAEDLYNAYVPPETPVADPVGDTYEEAQDVTLTSTGATNIYYTTDGSTPDATDTLYSGAIGISETTTLKAVGINASGSSPIMTEEYVISIASGGGLLTLNKYW